MDCYEAVSGTRMHATYYRPGGVYRDLPDAMPKYQESKFRSKKEVDRLNSTREGSVLDFIEDFTDRFPACVDEYETLLTDNRIWKQRTVKIGVAMILLSGGVFAASRMQAEEIAWQMGRPASQCPGEVGGFEERARYMIEAAPAALAARTKSRSLRRASSVSSW